MLNLQVYVKSEEVQEDVERCPFDTVEHVKLFLKAALGFRKTAEYVDMHTIRFLKEPLPLVEKCRAKGRKCL